MFTLISSFYILFLIMGCLIYYISPKRFQWVILLLLSIFFYTCAATSYTLVYVFITALTVYVGTLWSEKKKADGLLGQAKRIVLVALLLNIVLWFVLKGNELILLPICLFTTIRGGILADVIPAMGMGYYTAQAISYLMDCYWGIIKPQRNFFKVFLLLTYFPQMTNGPISRYLQIQGIYEKHEFEINNIIAGAQRILWGFAKKLILADRLSLLILPIMSSPTQYTGMHILIAVLLCPIQLYADFSGCMDIVLGSSELFGIILPENFNSPFFSKSYQEFWQRWHITLGTWSRDYILYPCLKSNWLNLCKEKITHSFGKKRGKMFATLVGMGCTWLVIGIWHGSWRHIIGTSLYSYIILMIGEYGKPLFRKMSQSFHIKTETIGWHVFQSIRTFILFTVVTMMFASLKKGLLMLKIIISMPAHFKQEVGMFLRSGLLGSEFTRPDMIVCIVMMVLLFIVGLLRERYGYAREWIAQRGIVIRWAIWIFLILGTMWFGLYGYGNGIGSFQYANF